MINQRSTSNVEWVVSVILPSSENPPTGIILCSAIFPPWSWYRMLRELRRARQNLPARWKFMVGSVRCAISRRKSAAPAVVPLTIAASSIKGRTGRTIKMFAIHSKYVLRAHGKIYYCAVWIQPVCVCLGEENASGSSLEVRCSPKCCAWLVGMYIYF